VQPYQPLVTIGVVSYSHEAYVLDALSSVLYQDYTNLEVFVIDDNSPDETAHLIQKFVDSHNLNWHLTLRKHNEGFCRNLNSLLSQAKGEFVFIIAGDDFMSTNRISSLVKRSNEMAEAAVIYSDCKIVNEQKKLVAPSFIEYYAPSKIYLPEGEVLQALVENNFICNTAVLMRTSALKEIGGFDERLILEDYGTWLTLADKGYSFAASKENTFSYRLHDKSALRKMGVRYYEDMFVIMSRLIGRNEPKLKKALKQNIYLCCKHGYYKESVFFRDMFYFFFRHFGFDIKLWWLYGLYLAGLKGSKYKVTKPSYL
jgi:glycosyltransferase involved in cell wall biosynthesis